MNQKRTKGFTLIELLAVIVILAIIALIAVPVILNIIDKANKSAFKDTAYGIIQAGELYFAEQQLELNGMQGDVTITLPDERIPLKGTVPEGQVKITSDGKISIAVQNGRYCVTKGLNDTDVTLTEGVENCKIPSEVISGTLSALATTGYITVTGTSTSTSTSTATSTLTEEFVEIPTCVAQGEKCAPGTPIVIKVKETEKRNFYVIADDGNKVTLIMSENLGDNVKWYDSTSGDNSHGPTKALEKLASLTNDWEIPEFTYTLSGLGQDGTTQKYPYSEVTAKARLITYEEAETLDCLMSSSCPYWMYANLYTNANTTLPAGYWTSTAEAGTSTGAWYVICSAGMDISPTDSTSKGVRPVIELSK